MTTPDICPGHGEANKICGCDFHQGRSPAKQRANEDACEAIFTIGGLMGVFALGYFVGEFIVALAFGWWA